MKEQVFAAQAENGNMLRGIVTLPDTMPGKKSGILLLGAGVNPRQSWHRLTVKIARLLAEDGFFSLRIDPQGIGDSDGEIKDIPPWELASFHDVVQAGLFKGDCKLALLSFKESFYLDELHIIGLCGGALTGLYLCEEMPDMKSLIYIAGPVTLAYLDLAVPVQPGYSNSLFRGYIKKIFNPLAWMRLIFGKSEYKTIYFLIKLKVLKALGKEHSILDSYVKEGKYEMDGEKVEKKKGDPINPLVPKAFLKYMSSGREMLFINAEIDQASWGFYNLFAPKYLNNDRKYNGTYKIKQINKANHTFSSDKAQKELLLLIQGWMKQFILK